MYLLVLHSQSSAVIKNENGYGMDKLFIFNFIDSPRPPFGAPISSRCLLLSCSLKANNATDVHCRNGRAKPTPHVHPEELGARETQYCPASKMSGQVIGGVFRSLHGRRQGPSQNEESKQSKKSSIKHNHTTSN